MTYKDSSKVTVRQAYKEERIEGLKKTLLGLEKSKCDVRYNSNGWETNLQRVNSKINEIKEQIRKLEQEE